MNFGIWCVALGAGAWLACYLLKDLFVDQSDAKNPLRSLTTGIGYAGLIAAAYGAVLIAVEVLR